MVRNQKGEVVLYGYGGLDKSKQRKGRRARPPTNVMPINYTEEEIEFMLWMDGKKRKERNYFPNWPTVLRWAKELGYLHEC